MDIPRRVLVVRLGAIGDVVNALVFANALHDARPDVEVGWAVHPLAAPLVEGHPSVDHVHVWRRRAGLGGLRELLREVRGRKYGLAVDLQRIAKSAFLARLSGAERVLGYDRARSKEFSWLLTKEHISPGSPHEHMVDQVLAFAHHLGLRAPARHELPSDPAAEAWAEQSVSEFGGAPLLLNLGASKPANLWSGERFGALARSLARSGVSPILLTGSEADRVQEQAALASAADAVRAGAVRSTVGATTLLQLAALQRRARLFVSADTGPMHMAVALGVPTVALFGAADPRRTGPYRGLEPDSPHSVLAGRADCAPCNRRTCPLPRHLCMDDLVVERVAAEVLARLGLGAARS